VQPERARQTDRVVRVHLRLDPPPPRRTLHDGVGSTGP
jgi:hypothetical protein